MDDMTHVWLLRTDLTSAQCRELFDLLSADERARASAFRSERDRTRYIAAHVHLRRLLARYTDAEPAALSLARDERGKPFLVAPARSGLHFNLSYSADLCAVAITDRCAVGVDVERQSSITFEALVDQHCSPTERAWLARLPAEDRLRGFYRCWTLKEAVLKASGQGLSIGLQHVSVISDSGQTIVDTGPELTGSYHAVELGCLTGYSGAVAWCGAVDGVVLLHSELH